MNGWLIAGGAMAAFCAAGHAFAGAKMFYQPIKSAVTDQLLVGVLTGMWHLITVHFVLSATALFFLGMRGQRRAWPFGSLPRNSPVTPRSTLLSRCGLAES